VKNNPNITTIITATGGHCAFVEQANDYDGYFAEQLVVDFLKEQVS
jgi:predicted alpha/beta-fold hydrolase